MKWLIWSPAIVPILSAFALPGGIALFAVPMLALGYFLFTVIALTGSEEHQAALRARAGHEQRQPTAPLRTERRSDQAGGEPPRRLVTTTGRRTA